MSEPDLSLDPVERFVGERFGIVRAVEPVALHPTLPSGLHLMSAAVSSPDAHESTAHHAAPGGGAWWDPAAAHRAALGEAAERYCARSMPTTLRHSTFNAVEADGAVDPESLALYSAEQYATPGFPFTRFDRSLTVPWTRGCDLDTGRPVLVPASLVYLQAVPPLVHVPVNAGLAAGPDRGFASTAALEELLERHCVATAWMSDDPLPRMPVPEWLARCLGPGIDTVVLLFPNEFELPVVAVVIRDEAGVIGMGTALRPTVAEAVVKAAAEAVVSCHAAHQLDDGDALASWLGATTGTALKPWRSDRRYRESYRADWRDVVDVFCHVQLYLDPEMHALLDNRLAPAPDGVAPIRELESRTGYLDRVRHAGLAAIAVDLTTPDVAACGLVVTRVVVPGLRSAAPAAFPFLGGRWRRPPTCALPLPHA